MGIDVRPEVVIRRPRAKVAAYMFDPTHEARWTTGVVESRPLQSGRLVKGAKVDRISKFMGREFPYRYECVDASGDEFVELEVTKPFPMRIRYQLEEIAEGTKASIHARGD